MTIGKIRRNSMVALPFLAAVWEAITYTLSFFE
jgi:hypothetical protein